MNIQAHSLQYFGDRFLLIARGNVKLRLADGTTMSSRYFAMDLHGNRYLLAGDVRIHAPHGVELRGAAYADFLDFGRAYYLPVINGPDRWTFFDGTFSNPHKGRLNPGDAFSLSDVPPTHPYISAHHADIIPRHELRFDAAMLDTGLAIVPVPNYVLNLSQNPNFAHNSLVGARFDASYPFAGSTNASTSIHFRENQASGIFAAIEQKIATPKGYVVGSIEPLDKELKQYNLLGSTRSTDHLQIEGFAQENAFQQGFAQPLNASAFLDGKVTKSLGHSYLQTVVNQYYESILGSPGTACNCVNNNADHVWVPNHPINIQFNWIGFDQRVNALPLHYRLRSGFGYAHDAYGIEAAANNLSNPVANSGSPVGLNIIPLTGFGVPTITSRTVGGTLYTNSIHLVHDHHGNDVNFNASLDLQRQGFSLPHHVDTVATSYSLSKTYGTHIATYLSYSQSDVRDDYGSQQALAYQPTLAASPSFGGFGTSRSETFGYVFTPNPNFNLNLTDTHGSDYFGLYGNSIAAELRARILPHLTIDITRNYYFGGTVTQHWSPQFGIYVGQ